MQAIYRDMTSHILVVVFHVTMQHEFPLQVLISKLSLGRINNNSNCFLVDKQLSILLAPTYFIFLKGNIEVLRDVRKHDKLR